MTMAGPVLELRNLNKEIPRPGKEPFAIFNNINLSVREGEFVSIVGPSGCGKTTMLRVINGLMPHSGGEIFTRRQSRRRSQRPDCSWALSFKARRCCPGAPV